MKPILSASAALGAALLAGCAGRVSESDQFPREVRTSDEFTLRE